MTPEDQILERLEEAFTKALSNPRNTNMEKVIQEVRGYEEFKDYNLDSFLKETTTPPSMHNMKDFPFGEGLKTQMILIDKARHEELLKQGLSEKAILLEEIMKREYPDQYKLQTKLRGIISRFQDAIDTKILRSCDDNLDEVMYSIFYLVNYLEELIKYQLVELQGEDLKKIEKGIEDMQKYAIGIYFHSMDVQNEF